MSLPQNFRNAVYGFNREDVVRYIEYLTNKNKNQVNQLSEENQRLQAELAIRTARMENFGQVEDNSAVLKERCAELVGRCADLEGKCADLEEQCRSLQDRLAEAPAAAEKDGSLMELQAEYEEKIAQLCQDHKTELEQQAEGFLDRIRTLEERLAGLEEVEKLQQEREAQELETYRRAERVERESRQRAERIREKADAVLARVSEQTVAGAERLNIAAQGLLGPVESLRAALNGTREDVMAAAETLKGLQTEE